MLYQETYRPRYHFSAPKGWLNDPNGVVWYRGEYHLFYQYYPHNLNWGPMHWGHAVSRDLVHWENLPVALYPDEDGMIFSGTVVIDKDDTSGLFCGGEGMVAVYTGHVGREGNTPIEYQCIAYSKDCGRTWTKYGGNPVLTAPDVPDAYDFRDPKVFWHEGTGKWIMFLGGGFYRVYSSADLIHWTLESESLIHEEFPDLFTVAVEGTQERKWVLNLAGFKYYIGSFDGKRFLREEGPYTSDWSDGCQATLTFNNMPDDRTAAIAWMRDGSRAPTDPWRNNMTVARKFTLRRMPDGTHRLVQHPVRELDRMHGREMLNCSGCVPAGEDPLKDVHGKYLDLNASVVPSENASKVRLRFRCDEKQHTDLVFYLENRQVFLDYTASASPRWRHLMISMDNSYFMSPMPVLMRGKCYPAPMYDGSDLKIRLLLDDSAAEIFLFDGLVSYTFNIYPDDAADGLSLTSDGEMEVRELTVTEMESIWNKTE